MSEFSSIRSYLWPIHRFELKKFIPVLLIFFLIAFNYNLLRTVKDAVVVTAPNSGAEAIPFIKMWVILPMAIVMTYIFTKLSNRFDREKVFYIMFGIFLSYFVIFTFFLYPNREILHPHQTANFLANHLPLGFQGLISIFRNWTFTSFYVMSELWSSAILTVLFWGFVNAIFNIKEAKRFYGILCIGANLANILSGKITQMFCGRSFNPELPFGTCSWDQSLVFINITIVLLGLLTMLIFRWLNKNVLNNEKSVHYKLDSCKKREKRSLRESFKYLAKSKYLICIAILVVAYNLSLNLVEVVWKNEIKTVYPNPQDYSHYMAQVNVAIGTMATLITIFISGGVIRRCGWTFSALVTPAVLLISGVAFFAFRIANPINLTAIASLLGSSVPVLIVFFGAMQNCLSRASKFTLFDATKEMSFIPLSDEDKIKGKAAIDGVGSRLGKSGGSLFLQGLICCLGSLSLCIPYIAAIFVVVIGVWIYATLSLGKEFNKLTENIVEEPPSSPPVKSTSKVTG